MLLKFNQQKFMYELKIKKKKPRGYQFRFKKSWGAGEKMTVFKTYYGTIKKERKETHMTFVDWRSDHLLILFKYENS